MGRDPPPQPYPYSFVEPLQGVGNELDAILPRCPTSLEDGPREAVEQLARRRLVAARVDGRVAGSDGERAGANREVTETQADFRAAGPDVPLHGRSEEHTSELQSLAYLVCR